MLRTTTGQWFNANPWVILFLLPAFLVCLLWVMSRISGWATLTRRFRANEAFYGETWSWQSAKFRRFFNFNNCLTVGASQEAFYLSVMIAFRLFHPPLL